MTTTLREELYRTVFDIALEAADAVSHGADQLQKNEDGFIFSMHLSAQAEALAAQFLGDYQDLTGGEPLYRYLGARGGHSLPVEAFADQAMSVQAGYNTLVAVFPVVLAQLGAVVMQLAAQEPPPPSAPTPLDETIFGQEERMDASIFDDVKPRAAVVQEPEAQEPSPEVQEPSPEVQEPEVQETNQAPANKPNPKTR